MKNDEYDLLSEVDLIKWAIDMGTNGVDYCVDWESYFSSLKRHAQSTEQVNIKK